MRHHTCMKHSSLLIASFAFALAACSAPAPDTAGTDEQTGTDAGSFTVVDTLPEGSFSAAGEDGFSGDLTVKGYSEIVEVDEPFCVEDCQTFDYVIFHVQETGNAALKDFMGQNEGNAYAGGNQIGLGCLEEDQIHYQNHSDGAGMTDNRISAEDTRTILNAEEGLSVTLRLTKQPLSGGTEAPACYSHFSEIEVSA